MSATERRQVWSWAFYDWANSAFATVVLAAFFPIFFKEYWAAGLEAAQSTLYLGAANSGASLLLVLSAPLLGAIADRSGLHKPLLLGFAVVGALATAWLAGLGTGQWFIAAMAFVVAAYAFSGANVFYDALLPHVASPQRLERVSALGYALGYFGGGLVFAVLVAMAARPLWFGLADAQSVVRLSFVVTALWWLLFSIPLAMYVRSPPPLQRAQVLSGGWRQLMGTLKDLRGNRVVWLFLLAYWLYIDGVDTIIRMAIDFGLALGFESSDLMMALLLTQLIGFPAALVFGHVGQRLGPRRGILIGLAVYLLVVAWAQRIEQVWEFYALAVLVGLVQGGVQALSRALFARIIPRDKSAEYFGFYNMLGKFAAVIGPVMVGWVTVASGDPRTGMLSVTVLFAAGGILLMRVDLDQGERLARKLESA